MAFATYALSTSMCAGALDAAETIGGESCGIARGNLTQAPRGGRARLRLTRRRAFYGPKIDMHMTDSLGRSGNRHRQLDYSMPRRFELTYTGADNAEHTPV